MCAKVREGELAQSLLHAVELQSRVRKTCTTFKVDLVLWRPTKKVVSIPDNDDDGEEGEVAYHVKKNEWTLFVSQGRNLKLLGLYICFLDIPVQHKLY